MGRSLRSLVAQTPLASLYDAIARRRSHKRYLQSLSQWTADDESRLNFYRQFIARGDLVFDVGANLGNRTKVFARLGATVIAVEPQPFCADVLETAFDGSDSVRVVRRALGRAAGQAQMHVAGAVQISSMSTEWMQAVRSSGRFPGEQWSGQITVEVDTLDHLIALYGMPAFIKIDVEGYEAEVMAGLTKLPRALSFEFTPEHRGVALQCINTLSQLAAVECQLVCGESSAFHFPEWLPADRMCRALDQPLEWGDVYVRSVPFTPPTNPR